jgi:hypothetical protein
MRLCSLIFCFLSFTNKEEKQWIIFIFWFMRTYRLDKLDGIMKVKYCAWYLIFDYNMPKMLKTYNYKLQWIKLKRLPINSTNTQLKTILNRKRTLRNFPTTEENLKVVSRVLKSLRVKITAKVNPDHWVKLHRKWTKKSWEDSVKSKKEGIRPSWKLWELMSKASLTKHKITQFKMAKIWITNNSSHFQCQFKSDTQMNLMKRPII